MPEIFEDEGNNSPSMPARRTPKPTPTGRADLHPALAWFRSVGCISLLAGGFGMTQARFFWWSVVLLYSGLVLLGLDLFFEPKVSRRFKIIGEVIILATLVAFSVEMVFVSAPIGCASILSYTDYSNGGAPGGIEWKSWFGELDLMVSNPTDGNYDDVDIWVRPDSPVAAIAQLSNLSDVSFEDYYAMTARMTAEDLSSKLSVPMFFLATTAGYKVHCGRIPPHSSLKIIMAVVDIKKPRAATASDSAGLATATPEDFIVDISQNTKGDISHYWYGSLKKLSIYGPKAKPTTISINGSFTATNRRRSVEQVIAIKQ